MPYADQLAKGEPPVKGTKSTQQARQVADYLNKIPHTTFVEPFHGKGNVWRATRPSEKEVLNDLSCSQMKLSKNITCGRKDQTKCERFEEAKKTCSVDYKTIVRRNDRSDTLIYLDPPFEKTSTTAYKEKSLSLEEFSKTVKSINNASVAISYSDNPEFKKEFCGHNGFTCHKINSHMFTSQWHELLAVKK